LIVLVLGSAAGGGVPQWNCACPNCTAVRRGERPARTQSSFAFSKDGERWWLVNASPDIAQQIEAQVPLRPRGLRDTPIAGFLFTDANVDHMGGLAVVRQDGPHRFASHSSAVVREIAASQPAYAPFTEPPHTWQTLEPERTFALEPGLDVRPLAVPGLTPGYDGRRDLPGAVFAYEIVDAHSGGSVLFAPVFSRFDDVLRSALGRVKLAFLDGSFWAPDELGEVGVAKFAARLGHLPVGGPEGSLAALGDAPQRTAIVYAHLNNTSPLLQPSSAAAQTASAAGVQIATDGMRFEL
jgi:pyrroloquinoline quinone biosynthesis protein B